MRSSLVMIPLPSIKILKLKKRAKVGQISKLKVGNKTYTNSTVKDGFYDSISQLKTTKVQPVGNRFEDLVREYENILEVCKHGAKIPPISEKEAFDNLENVKPSVNYLYGVTAYHYKYAGPAGYRHFFLLLNCLLQDIHNTTIDEINSAYACILFKGHKKDKSSSRSYRTISTCPIVAKGLDLYIRDLHIKSWNSDQAETQFQGEGSSQDLAAVLLTESIEYSLHTLNQPVYILYLDAQSAFDVVQNELLVRNLFHCSTPQITPSFTSTIGLKVAKLSSTGKAS